MERFCHIGNDLQAGIKRKVELLTRRLTRYTRPLKEDRLLCSKFTLKQKVNIQDYYTVIYFL